MFLPMNPRLSDEDQKQIDAVWNNMLTPVNRVEHVAKTEKKNRSRPRETGSTKSQFGCFSYGDRVVAVLPALSSAAMAASTIRNLIFDSRVIAELACAIAVL